MEQKMGLVLCVDDEPNILRSLNWLLRKDFDVITASSGHEALALVREHDFDVIISDQRMPGMTGVELLREACQISPRAMRILLTGYSDLQAVMRSVNESEVFRFINKPWHVNDLPKIVAEAASIAKSQPARVPTPVVTEQTEIAEQAAVLEHPETVLLIDDDPMVMELLRIAVGPGMRILHATSLGAAVDMVASEDVGVVISDTLVNHVDTTRLLKVMKEKIPGIVTVMLSSDADVGDIVGLINQGQIYRFVPKPIKAGFLRRVVASAILKNWQLRENPDYAKRHFVDQLAATEKDALMKEVRLMTSGAAIPNHINTSHPREGESLIHRMGMGFRRLFGT
jgi:serine/threonine-protein kinase